MVFWYGTRNSCILFPFLSSQDSSYRYHAFILFAKGSIGNSDCIEYLFLVIHRTNFWFEIYPVLIDVYHKFCPERMIRWESISCATAFYRGKRYLLAVDVNSVRCSCLKYFCRTVSFALEGRVCPVTTRKIKVALQFLRLSRRVFNIGSSNADHLLYLLRSIDFALLSFPHLFIMFYTNWD